MGIRGLTAFLKQGSLSSISDHVDLSVQINQTGEYHIIVIDGNAFSHWFCMECLGIAPSLNTNYGLLRRQVITWIRKCHATKVECVFVFDGSTEPDKLQCRLDRLCKQSANINFTLSQQLFISKAKLPSDHLHESCDISSEKDYNKDTKNSCSSSKVDIRSTPPLLAISCIINAIKDCTGTGAKAFYADGEADKTIVEVSTALKATAIMSNDSDMLIYDTGSVGFIPFWAFGFANDGSLNAFIIRRRKVANLMGISEESLPLLAALVGNDFTSAETCYQMHKILFEGRTNIRKLNKNIPCSKSEVPLSLDDLDLTDSRKIAEGKRRRISAFNGKPKKRSDSMSSSVRMKERRRTNRSEEESKRKANYVECNNKEVPLSSSYGNTASFGDSSCLFLKDESISELQSSAGSFRSYGESGIKTVKAAAEFLKKVEVGGSISVKCVTACLLDIPEEEVLDCISKKNDIESLEKQNGIEFLCTSFFTSFQDSIERYQLSIPRVSLFHIEGLQPKVNSIEIPTIAPTISALNGGSALRCCYRCCLCSPCCSEIYKSSLNGLLTAPQITENTSTTFPLSHLDPSTTLRLSPDMEQVIRYRMFIGRTPCQLRTHLSFDFPKDLIPKIGPPIDDDNESISDTSESKNSPFLNYDSDYVYLQSLRRKLYGYLFNEDHDRENRNEAVGVESENMTITEIFKKNNSPFLDQRTIIVSNCNDEQELGITTVSSNLSAKNQYNLRTILMNDVNLLTLGANSLKVSQFIKDSYGIRKIENSSLPDKLGNQLTAVLIATGLFIRISNSELSMVESNETSIEKLNSSQEHSSRNRRSEALRKGYIQSLMLDALAFAISCTVTLVKDTSLPSTVESEIHTDNKELECENRKDRIANDNISLTFINVWTRLQLCVQHLNFSIEVAARNLLTPTRLTSQRKHQPNGEDDSQSEKRAFFGFVLGFDVGLLDIIIFSTVRSELKEAVGKSNFNKLGIQSTDLVPILMVQIRDIVFSPVLALPSTFREETITYIQQIMIVTSFD